MHTNQEIIRLRGCYQTLESKLAEKEETFVKEIKSLKERLEVWFIKLKIDQRKGNSRNSSRI